MIMIRHNKHLVIDDNNVNNNHLFKIGNPKEMKQRLFLNQIIIVIIIIIIIWEPAQTLQFERKTSVNITSQKSAHPIFVITITKAKTLRRDFIPSKRKMPHKQNEKKNP